jgi:pSer/pThr/pTyr-binding forkhead associated (FHA) protein
MELEALMRLDTELRSEPSVWLLVEVKPYGVPMYMSVLRVENTLVIGRDPSCGLVLEGTLVSRRHTLLHATPTGLVVEDISRHGTLVDGLPLQAARKQVENETVLVIGCNRVRLRRLG